MAYYSWYQWVSGLSHFVFCPVFYYLYSLRDRAAGRQEVCAD